MSAVRHTLRICSRHMRSLGLPRGNSLLQSKLCTHHHRQLLCHTATADPETLDPGTQAVTQTDPGLGHIPVMKEEVLDIIDPQPGQVIVDMTFGAGGHSLALLQTCPDITIYAVDRDPLAHQAALQVQKQFPQVSPVQGRFSEVVGRLGECGVEAGTVAAVLMDLGASSMQFDNPQRGFSLSQDGPLDMRMDNSRGVTAADVVNHVEESALGLILRRYGEERGSRHIARAIVDARWTTGHITSTKQLAQIISSAFDGPLRRDKLNRFSHVATKTFQALRIFVNDEMNEINNGLEAAYQLLSPGGVCVALSFHSLEDRIVKRHFHGISLDEPNNRSLSELRRGQQHKILSGDEMSAVMKRRWKPISRHIAMATDAEIEANPRARSAKLRAAHKLGDV